MEHSVNINDLTEKLLNSLDARSRDIVIRRFGLKSGQAETLESIGKEYGITRERVRQIESYTKKTLATLREQITPLVDLLEKTFAEHGGVMAEPHVVEVIGAEPQVVRFYLNVLPEYIYVTHKELFHPHWRHERRAGDDADKIVECACEILVKKQLPLEESELIESVKVRLAGEGGALPSPHIIAAFVASKPLERTVFQQWGLAEWPEVSPRGVGDKAYAVLRRHGKPAHFREIASMISEAKFDTKAANPQTVHNELIKDDRFVLVGRGLYGLKEWGYVPGTVADVLEAILRRAKVPMTREELTAEVLKQRIVKKNTILLGLQNHKRFVRTADQRYTLR
ncbi:MAG: HTH domain-containing protein [Patescibacteria group bacterium]